MNSYNNTNFASKEQVIVRSIRLKQNQNINITDYDYDYSSIEKIDKESEKDHNQVLQSVILNRR